MSFFFVGANNLECLYNSDLKSDLILHYHPKVQVIVIVFDIIIFSCGIQYLRAYIFFSHVTYQLRTKIFLLDTLVCFHDTTSDL